MASRQHRASGSSGERVREKSKSKTSPQKSTAPTFKNLSKVPYYDPYASFGRTSAFSGTNTMNDTFIPPDARSLQIVDSMVDPQEPRRRPQSARRTRQDWPYVPCANLPAKTLLYSEFLHRPTHVPSSLPRDAQAPARWGGNGVHRAYNSAYKSLGHTNFLGSRNIDPQTWTSTQHRVPLKYAEPRHPSCDGMSTRNYAFPAACPVHSYTAHPNWSKTLSGVSRVRR